ncbi:hypothetical protein C7475_111129 [Chitinophaga sp. S165]|nr:hypothetical protein C7475_111129 [Chitinophaga sp. S165]
MKLILLLMLFTSAGKFQSDKVYVCRSGSSYAYHNRLCQGLRKCTHRIDTVTVREAMTTGHKKPCGYRY